MPAPLLLGDAPAAGLSQKQALAATANGLRARQGSPTIPI